MEDCQRSFDNEVAVASLATRYYWLNCNSHNLVDGVLFCRFMK